MSQIPYRGNLSAAVFPMTIAKSGRSVINPGADQNFDKRVDPGASPGSVGIPQVMYCENVLPTPEGFQSVGLLVTGNIEIGTGIRVVETMRLATEIDETSVTPDIDILDEGDEIGSWIKSPNDTGGSDYRSVDQDAVTGNPAPSYLFVYDRNEFLPAYLYRDFGVSGTTDFSMSFDCKFSGDAGVQQVVARFLTTSTGVGLGLTIAGETNKIVLATRSGWSNFSGFVELEDATMTGYTIDTWYTVTITAVKNPDTTWTIQCNMVDATTLTLVASLVYGMNYTPGGYAGFVCETGETSAGTRYQTHIDNIHIEADAADVSYTSVTGIANVDVTFRENDTALWSFGSSEDYDNLAVITPVGFESPHNPEDLSWTLVRGILFVCIKNANNSTHIYQVTYDDLGPTLEFEEVTAAIASSLGIAFNINNVVGIVGSYNYLVLLTPDSAIWSSTLSLTDFAPSLVSGAGSERIGNLKGDIQFAKEHVAGFFLYTNGNVVFATYTGNARYPWKFREVADSSGYTYPQQVVGDTNSAIQYGISNAKLIQAIQPAQAELIAQEATNFFERSTTWDIFNGSNEFEVLSQNDANYLLPVSGKYRIWLALDRYIVLGYYSNNSAESDEPISFNAAIVYDILEKRYGKLNTRFHQLIASEKAFYLVNFTDGAKIKIEMNIENEEIITQSVILLGKFCLLRDHMIQLQGVVVESGNEQATVETPSFTLSLIPTLNGKTFLPAVTPTVDIPRSSGIQMVYNIRSTAKNWCFLIRGKFDLVGVEMMAVDAGKR